MIDIGFRYFVFLGTSTFGDTGWVAIIVRVVQRLSPEIVFEYSYDTTVSLLLLANSRLPA